jgi:solute carrier family 50 protein (sugar transporter)
MLSTKVIILEYFCPAMGTIIATIMFSAPYRDLKKAIDRGHMGDLNPTPWAFMLGNCFGWVVYSILLQNLWIFVANCPGFILSVWLNLGAAKLIYQGHHSRNMRESFAQFLQEQSESQRAFTLSQQQSGAPSKTVTDWAKLVWNVTSQTTPAPAPHETMVLMIVLIWTACISLISFAQAFDSHTRELIVGVLVNLNLVFFYGAPLSTIWTVLRDRNSISIHLPTMITNTLNGSFWTAYGLAVLDPFIYVPNALGAVLGVVQIVLILVFPRNASLPEEGAKREIASSKEDDDNPTTINNDDDKFESRTTLEMVQQPAKNNDSEDLERI